jgi:DNA polymerase-1
VTAEPSPTRKLVVIDGANAIFRAFFAIPNLRAPDGSPTNAAYGFVNMLAKVVREEGPDYIAVAYDAHGGTFRHRLYPAYKAGRDATPEDLSAQIPVVRELIDAHRVPLVEVPDLEADDVIATLVARAPQDLHVAIVSTDKDLMQLVSERVSLVDGVKDRRYGPAEVEERFGVPTAQMLDLRALVGDPSDNIPGVKGIGEKGGAALIREWGSLERLLEHADEVKAKRAREALLEQAEQARLSKRLATLREDADLPLELEQLVRREPDRERLHELYRRLGFGRLLAALEAEGDSPGANSSGDVGGEGGAVEIEIATRPAELEDALEAAASELPLSLLVVSGEGSALDAPLVGLALALAPDRAVYVPFLGVGLAAEEGVELKRACEILASRFEGGTAPDWIGVDVKQAQSLLSAQGLELPVPASDLELGAFLLDPSGARQVSALAAQWLGLELASWEELAGRGAKAVASAELPVERCSSRWRCRSPGCSPAWSETACASMKRGSPPSRWSTRASCPGSRERSTSSPARSSR